MTRTRSVCAAITDSKVHVSRNRGWVRVVLHADEVEADPVADLGQREDLGDPVGRGSDERAEEQLVAVIHGI